MVRDREKRIKKTEKRKEKERVKMEKRREEEMKELERMRKERDDSERWPRDPESVRARTLANGPNGRPGGDSSVRLEPSESFSTAKEGIDEIFPGVGAQGEPLSMSSGQVVTFPPPSRDSSQTRPSPNGPGFRSREEGLKISGRDAISDAPMDFPSYPIRNRDMSQDRQALGPPP